MLRRFRRFAPAAPSEPPVEVAFLQHLLQSFELWWGTLATWTKLEPEQVRALTQQVERAYGSKLEQIREARDLRLAAILQGLERARKH